MLASSKPPSSRSLYIALLGAIRRRQQHGSPFQREQLEQLLSHLPLHHRRNLAALLLEILLKRKVQREEESEVCHETPLPSAWSPPLDVGCSMTANNCSQRLSVRRDLYRSCASNIDRSTSATPTAPRPPLSENNRSDKEQQENLTRLVNNNEPPCVVEGCQNAVPGMHRERILNHRRPSWSRRTLPTDARTPYPTTTSIRSHQPGQNYFRSLAASGSCPNINSPSSDDFWNTVRTNSWCLDRLSPNIRRFDFDDSSSTIFNSYPNPFLPVFGQAADTNTESVTPVTSSSSCSPQSTRATSPKEESNEISSSSSSNGCASSSSAGGDTSNGSVSSSNNSNSSNVTASVSTTSSTNTTTTCNNSSGVSTSRCASKLVGPSSIRSSINPFAPPTAEASVPLLSRPVLAAPKLGGFSSSVSGSLTPSRLLRPLGSSILAPPTLFGADKSSASLGPSVFPSESMTKFKLKPSILGSAISNNPFSKAAADIELDTKDSEAKAKSTSTDASENEVEKMSDKTSVSSSVATSSNSCISSTDLSASASADEANCTEISASSSSKAPGSSPNSSRRSKEGPSSAVTASKSLFGAFSHSDHKRPMACSSPSPSGPLLPTNGVKSPSSSFVFGRDLHSRVEGKTIEGNPDDLTASSSAAGSLESSGLIFSAAASTLASQSGSSSVNGGPSKDLETSSRELAERESSGKRKFEPVQVLTGEETESNVIQMNCKVYCWVKGGWQERGRGVLRLNDWGSGGEEMHSRLLVRTQGTFSVMLNTNIWGEMVVERASSKSVRFTASDPGGQPVIYLVMGLPKEIDTLHSSLEWRISNAKRRESCKRARVEDAPSSSTPSL
ncbi:Ran binding domain [Trinorchestia longiramus]|nr:Ran binding domain [Trinorchestia longiramus]